MSPAWYKFLADAVIVFHFAFVGFVLLGGLLALRWRRVAWVHLPCVAWGIWIELSHGLCPLTPLENDLRAKAGRDTYEGGFVNHYIMPILYPEGLTPQIQITIACIIIAMNGACYGFILWKWYQGRQRRRGGADVVTASPPTAADPLASAVDPATLDAPFHKPPEEPAAA
jgi:hypothetical protein